MSSKRERIMAHIELLLSSVAVAASSPIPVQRSRADQYDRTEAPAITLGWESDDVREWLINGVERDLIVQVGVYTRGDVPDQLADPIVVALHAAVMGDTGVGGLALDTVPLSQSVEIDAADQTGCIVNSRYRVWYRHKREDLTL